ncbi:MAG: SGNH/GDSL hydrolase family protein [Candidatus Moduliflexus flocculans]|nr:SGNH/GDSL hydrolase family protein [Candidatus Moduliflexus flocculans]
MLRLKSDVARRLNVPLVDLTADVAAQGKALYLEADPVHLNAAGNAIVARRLFESMTNRLGQ